MANEMNPMYQDIANTVAQTLYDPANHQLADPSLLNHYAFISKRKYWLDVVVDSNAIELEKQIFLWNMEDAGKPAEERQPIWIYLMNYGGDADCGWSLIDAILASETPVYTVNVGVAASAAALIFMAGHKRFMMKNATVTIHEGSAQISGDSTKVLDGADSYKAMLNHMHEYITSRTSIPKATLNKKKNNDWELKADECLKYDVTNAVVNNLSEVI